MIRRMAIAATAATAALACAGSAGAAELLLGAYIHDAAFIGGALGTGSADREKGADIELGLRSGRIQALRLIGSPQAHGFVSINTDRTSDFVAAGLSWPIRITDRFYFRPGLGLAYTDGKVDLPPVNAPGLAPPEIQRRLHLYETRIDFGSRTLFEPELNLGYHVTPRMSVELSWVHISNGEIFHHGKNQGLDDVGARMVYALGAR
ncbi:MAG: acyloxyacyl hydrolase [Alphaproteobacteria bacterium]|nr:acyloxyacyl hydrolase [Alphaproteobacteria bacterium]